MARELAAFVNLLDDEDLLASHCPGLLSCLLYVLVLPVE